MSRWPQAPLGEAIELAYGKSLPKGKRVSNGKVPVYGSNGIAGWHDTAVTNEPTVIVGRKGSAGAVQYVEGPCYPIDTTYFIRVRTGFQFDIKFLFYLLRQLDLSRLKTATGVPGLTREDAYRELIPVPPLTEQRRIVDILSRAEGIVRLRREAQKKAAEIISALFLDMFGDPATNPKGWPVVQLGAHIEIPSVVRTPDLNKEADKLCIGADSIESNTGKLISRPLVRDVVPKSGKYQFATGDVLYSKIRPYLAKATLADCNGFCSADMYPLRCRPDVRANFLLWLLLSRAFTAYATAESVRAQMPKLNREALFAYQFPIPPIAVQKEFERLVADICSIQSQQNGAIEKSEATFNALLSQAFTSV